MTGLYTKAERIRNAKKDKETQEIIVKTNIELGLL